MSRYILYAGLAGVVLAAYAYTPINVQNDATPIPVTITQKPRDMVPDGAVLYRNRIVGMDNSKKKMIGPGIKIIPTIAHSGLYRQECEWLAYAVDSKDQNVIDKLVNLINEYFPDANGIFEVNDSRDLIISVITKQRRETAINSGKKIYNLACKLGQAGDTKRKTLLKV